MNIYFLVLSFILLATIKSEIKQNLLVQNVLDIFINDFQCQNKFLYCKNGNIVDK